jgi:ABC-type lipoprotein release transport system permease subunit
MVLADGLRMAALGAAACVLMIPLTRSLLEAFLFNVKTFDPVAVAGAPAALLAAAVLASVGPAWSAMRSDPSVALREE